MSLKRRLDYCREEQNESRSFCLRRLIAAAQANDMDTRLRCAALALMPSANEEKTSMVEFRLEEAQVEYLRSLHPQPSTSLRWILELFA